MTVEKQSVFVLASGCYSDMELIAVFTNEADAKAMCDIVYDGSVFKLPLDPLLPIVPQGLTRFGVVLNKELEVKDVWESSHDGLPGIDFSKDIYSKNSNYGALRLIGSVWAKTQGEAVIKVIEHFKSMVEKE